MQLEDENGNSNSLILEPAMVRGFINYLKKSGERKATNREP
jgi:hypothetical protein